MACLRLHSDRFAGILLGLSRDLSDNGWRVQGCLKGIIPFLRVNHELP